MKCIITTFGPISGLECLGFQPILILTLQNLLNLQALSYYVLTRTELEYLEYQQEINRWFPLQHDKINVLLPTQTFQEEKEENILIVDFSFALLSEMSVRNFIQDCDHKNGILVSKVKNIHPLHHVLGSNIVFAGALFLTPPQVNLPTLDDSLPQYFLDSSVALVESVLFDIPKEKQYAEHLFLERKHSLFLQQCFSLWKKCQLLEEKMTDKEK